MSNSAYRHRRIQAQLDRWGITAGAELVRQLTCELGLEPCRPRPKRFNLARTAAGQVPDFAGDNTSISTGEAALATAIDCCMKGSDRYAMNDQYQTPDVQSHP